MNETITNNSLKEYYIELKKLTDNAVSILNAINTSFNSYTPEVSLTLSDSNTKIRIPSFLYLENKIENLETSLNTLFNLPKSGEAWFSNETNMYKLNMVQSNVAPSTPIISYNNSSFNFKENNFFKDLVFPKTFLKFDLSNISNNISEVLLKKVILYNDTLISNLFDGQSTIDYNTLKERLYLMNEGIDYSEYDTKLNIPLKTLKYNSRFNILDIIKFDDSTVQNPRYDDTTKTLIYTLRLDTLTYYDSDDNSISYTLKVGDRITLQNNYNIFKVYSINTYNGTSNDNSKEYIVELQEINGHTVLNTTANNPDCYFMMYVDPNNNIDKYVEVPLEENQYVIFFISSIYNNVRSQWSEGVKINLNEINIKYNNETLTYIEFYNKYCKNLGDIISSIGECAYPQLSSYTNSQLKELTTGTTIRTLVTDTLGKENNQVLNVTAINTHIVDDELSNSLASLHKQKIELQNELANVNSNIDTTYNQLVNNDFSASTSQSQEYIKKQLDDYYNERQKYQQQIISVINNIDLIKNDVVGFDSLKHRVRGITNANDLNESGTESEIVAYLHNTYGTNCDLIGLEVEYKYKNIRSNTSTVENNSNTIFTDWIRINNIEKQRYLKFDNITNTYKIEYVNYDTNSNVIKWNQIDIPINDGEDVVIRIRYKYNIGQPFINLYTPWSNEVTISYNPDNTSNVTDISSIISANDDDTINAKFMKELINGGYQEHVLNKIVDNSQVYYHMPENIYSGFNTAENKLISLKDKLTSIDNDINEYKSYINNELTTEYEVYLLYDDQTILLSKNTINSITIKNNNNNFNSFVRKDMNIMIKNVGSTPINMYSIFPGNTSIPLLSVATDNILSTVTNYERVPLTLDNVEDPTNSVVLQTMGQWIYFRQNNPYTLLDLYHNDYYQRIADNATVTAYIEDNTKEQHCTLINQKVNIANMSQNNMQLLLGYRNRNKSDIVTVENSWLGCTITNWDNGLDPIVDDHTTHIDNVNILGIDESGSNIFVYTYPYILKYEHFYIKHEEDESKEYLTPNKILTDDVVKSIEYIDIMKPTDNGITTSLLSGMFLIPNLQTKNQLLCDDTSNSEYNNQYKKIRVGDSATVPVLLEYYVEKNTQNNITKTIAFDLRPSLTRQIDNYILKVTLTTSSTDTETSEYSPQLYTNVDDV